tara:strand:+ start:4428 stop:4889 length:462 start_codon:yes stop_codon:yes gene_type:complete
MSEKDFKLRNRNRIAEPKAIEYLNRRMIPFVRAGLDALDCDAPIWKIPALIRAIPDYIIFNQHDQPLFFEAKGFKGMVKLKIRDLKNYRLWNTHLEITFFLYSIDNDAYCEVMFSEIVRIIKERKPEIKAYPENPENKYYEIPTHWLPDFTNF